MTNILESNKKKWLSNFILLSFLLLVGITAFLSNAFKTPIKSHNEFIEQALVFNNKELDKVTRLTLKNKSGDFSFERVDTSPNSPWHMTAPKNLTVSSVFIEKLFGSLNTIKTKKLLIDDKTNVSNFSLEKPTAILTLTDDAGKSILLSIGIMNTIDNSTYMKISGRSGIYHVEAPSISLENITIADLANSTVFDFDLKKLVSFKIIKKKSKAVLFEVRKQNDMWTNAEGKRLTTSRLEDLIGEFTNLKSSFVIDEKTAAQTKETSAMLSEGDYSVLVTLLDNKVLTYQVGSITNSIPDLNLNGEDHFIIVEAGAPVVYVVKKEFFTLFEMKNENLNSLIEPAAP